MPPSTPAPAQPLCLPSPAPSAAPSAHSHGELPGLSPPPGPRHGGAGCVPPWQDHRLPARPASPPCTLPKDTEDEGDEGQGGEDASQVAGPALPAGLGHAVGEDGLEEQEQHAGGEGHPRPNVMQHLGVIHLRRSGRRHAGTPPARLCAGGVGWWPGRGAGSSPCARTPARRAGADPPASQSASVSSIHWVVALQPPGPTALPCPRVRGGGCTLPWASLRPPASLPGVLALPSAFVGVAPRAANTHGGPCPHGATHPQRGRTVPGVSANG